MRAAAYGRLERWLHWLALEPISVRHLAFELDRRFALPQGGAAASGRHGGLSGPADGAVYVCGLARSGTTMLLRILDQIDDFRSLRYRDMPFVLAPNLWRWITRQTARPATPVERVHGDGIMVDFDSPESFEEVFWQTFAAPDSGLPCLPSGDATPELVQAFADYRALVANPQVPGQTDGGKMRRYLSKNNNNLVRLSVLSADPTTTLLVVYRDPVATARSLLRQHQRFSAAQGDNIFMQSYMRWLGHHEFGLNHRPYCFALPGMPVAYPPDGLNYWLQYWTAVYGYLLASPPLRLHFIDHDQMCAQPVLMLQALFALLGVRADAEVLARPIVMQVAETDRLHGICPELLAKAQATHWQLRACAQNLPCLAQPVSSCG